MSDISDFMMKKIDINKHIEKIKKEPLLLFNLKEILTMVDIYTLTILGIYTLLAIIFYHRIIMASNLIMTNMFIAAAIITMGTVGEKFKAGRLFTLIRKMYIVPLIFFIYSQAQFYIRVINPHDYDQLLINWDRFIFGVNPTQWLMNISFPFLTEYLQICYFTFFIMAIFHGFELHFAGKDKEFMEFSRSISFSFFVSYLIYFILPAVGPRFTLHNFSTINQDLPGIFFTNFLRDFVNVGGGVPLGSLHPDQFVNRDCMASGHTWLTIVNVYLSFRYHSRFKWLFLLIGGSLIFATVYLRYHYVVDLLAGIIFAVISLSIEPKIRAKFKKAGFVKA